MIKTGDEKQHTTTTVVQTSARSSSSPSLCNDTEITTTNTCWSFLTSPTTLFMFGIRVACLIPPPGVVLSSASSSTSSSFLLWFLHNPELKPLWTSLLVRPYETFSHVKEAQAIRNLVSSSGEGGGSIALFRNAYVGSQLHLPPLVVAVMEGFIRFLNNETYFSSSSSSSSFWQSFAVGLGLHLMDLWIALLLLKLGHHVLLASSSLPQQQQKQQQEQEQWEDELQPKIPTCLQPTALAHVFPVIRQNNNNNSTTFINDEVSGIVKENDKKNYIEGTNNDENSSINNDDDNDKNLNESMHNDGDIVSLRNSKPWFHWNDMPLLAAQLYFYSPWTILASSVECFQNIWFFFLLQSLNEATTKSSCTRIPLVAFWLACGTYMELQYVAYLIPTSLWIYQHQLPKTKNAQHGSNMNGVFTLLLSFATWFVSLQGLSFLLVGKSQWASVLYSSFGHVYTWKHLHPNLSVLWYLNMELFEQYRIYFSVLIGGLPFLMLTPLAIRLHRYPMELVTIFWMLWTLMRPTSTLVDANIACCLAFLCPRSLVRMRIATSLIPAFAIMVPVSLYLVTLWLWLETGSGEANFTFFQCLAYCAFLAILFLEFCGASLRRDKVLRLTEKRLLQEEKSKETTIENSDE